MPKRIVRACAVAAVLIVVTGIVALTRPATAVQTAPPFVGTLIEQRADSQISKHDGYYYFTGTVPEYDRIVLRRSRTLQGLATAPEVVIWRKHATGEMASQIWAPEIHFIDDQWYIYFTAGHKPNIWDIRMYVLEAIGHNPLTASWTEKGQIVTGIGAGTFALDASLFVEKHTGKRYLTWAEKPAANSPINTNIYIAELGANPWTIAGTPTMISSPTLPWETVGFKVNEGPTVLQHDERLFLTYSASATDAHYCLGMLTAKAESDLLDPASWTKSPRPVFATDAAAGQYGPGHNSFTKAEDGRTDMLVYHDRNYRDIVGDPLNDPNRRTRVQPFTWNADGTPHFGTPVADASTPTTPEGSGSPTPSSTPTCPARPSTPGVRPTGSRRAALGPATPGPPTSSSASSTPGPGPSASCNA
jgi:GH43 family beta-xylosidase